MSRISRSKPTPTNEILLAAETVTESATKGEKEEETEHQFAGSWPAKCKLKEGGRARLS